MFRVQQVLLFTAAACICQQARAVNEITACEDKSMYVMDLSMFAAEHSIPSCSYTVSSYPNPFCCQSTHTLSWQ